MLVKTAPAKVKAAGDGAGEGIFTALVSVFGNEDSVGDVVMAGAFTDTLKSFDSEHPIPVIWTHDWADPFSHIGYVTESAETAEGLQVTGQLDMDNPKAAQVFRLMKGGRVTQFSFAYDVIEGAYVTSKDEDGDYDGYYELRTLKLYEVGPTLVGANQATELLGIKGATLQLPRKTGRVLAEKHLASLKDAHAAIGKVIDAATPADDEPKTSEPEGSKSGSIPDPLASVTASSQVDDVPASEPASPAAKSQASAQALARLQLTLALS